MVMNGIKKRSDKLYPEQNLPACDTIMGSRQHLDTEIKSFSNSNPPCPT
jgi:hypothetical protein